MAEPGSPAPEERGYRDSARFLLHQYRTLLDDLGAVVWEMDMETRRILYISDSIQKVMGFPAEAWTRGGMSWIERVHPDDLNIALGPLEELSGSSGSRTHILRARAADDSIVWLHTALRTGLDAGGRQVFRGVSVDITEHRRSETELKRALSMLTATLDSTTDGILVVDLEDHVRGYNQRFVDLWRIPDEVLRSGEDRRLIAWVLDQLVDPDAFASRVRTLYGNPESSSFDTLEFRDGRVYERYSQPQRVEGRCVGRVWSFRDVTERRRAERALQDSEQRLRLAQKLEAVGRLAGGVAHDFNNILTAVLGNASLIAADPAVPAALREHARDIELAASRAALLTRQLLAFSSRQRLEMRVVDLNQVVAEMDKLVRVTLGERIELVLRGTDHPCLVRVDRGQIEQVILNLVLNGRDAMPGGGTLEISIDRVEEPASRVRLVVRDTGHGMDAETRTRIFEPFFTTKERGQGTGLGLATVYGIVQQSHGAIEVESAPGQGTTFRITLPRAVAPADEHAPAPAPPAAIRGHETVLVVEDEKLVRDLLCESLRAAGHVVIEAADGEAAQRAATLHDGEIHLLVTDVVMPGITGIELSARLARQRPRLRVLFISGFADASDPSHLLEGSGAFLQKPFTMETLVAKVRETLDAPGGARQGQ